jgi:hypothetical protein
MKQAFTLLLLFVNIFFGELSGAAAPGQQSRSGSPGTYTMQVNAEEVVLNCTVLDNKGQPVKGLNKTNFKVFRPLEPKPLVNTSRLVTNAFPNRAR